MRFIFSEEEELVNRTGKLTAQWLALALTCLPMLGAAAAEAAAPAEGSEQLATVRTGIPHDAIYDMSIVGAHGIAVGAFGQILESKDAGASWASVASPTQFGLFGVAVNGDHKVIVGQRGTVLLGKADGGWEAVKTDFDSRLMKVGMNASGLTIAVGEFGTVVRSKDFGRTWEKLKLDWASFREDGYEPHLYSAIVSDNGRIVLGAEFAYVIVSTDGGDNWHLATKGEKSIFSMFMLPDGSGFAVGQEGLVMKTADSGDTWTTIDAKSNANLFGVWCSQHGEVVVTGQRALLRSSDGGATWVTYTDLDVIRNWYLPIAVGEADMKAAGGEQVSQTVYVAGHNGRIARLLQ